jgi:membrane fusion protein (multidrug efflux system)
MNRISKWLYLPAALAIILLVGFSLKKSKGNESDASKKKAQPKTEKQQIAVDAFIVKPSLLIDEISISGSLLAYEEVDLKSEVAGRVVKMYLPEGQFVKKGTLLVKLYDDDLQADLQKLKIQLAIQEQIYKRQSGLLQVNGISKNDYELTGLQLNSIKADIEVEKVQIRKTEVLAPFDGVIGLRNISPGAEVTPATILATIRSENKLKLDFSIPEKYSSELKPGMQVRFTMNNTDKLYDATVMATEQGIDEFTRNLKVRAVVDNQSDHLLPGSFTDVQLRLNEKRDALMIPTQSIIPDEQNKSVIVAKDGKAHFADVKTGVRKASRIEVTEGLQPGDTIITTGVLFLKEGSKLLYSTVKADSI